MRPEQSTGGKRRAQLYSNELATELTEECERAGARSQRVESAQVECREQRAQRSRQSSQPAAQAPTKYRSCVPALPTLLVGEEHYARVEYTDRSRPIYSLIFLIYANSSLMMHKTVSSISYTSDIASLFNKEISNLTLECCVFSKQNIKCFQFNHVGDFFSLIYDTVCVRQNDTHDNV